MAKCRECEGTGIIALVGIGGKPHKTCDKCKGTGEIKGGRPKKDEEEE